MISPLTCFHRKFKCFLRNFLFRSDISLLETWAVLPPRRSKKNLPTLIFNTPVKPSHVFVVVHISYLEFPAKSLLTHPQIVCRYKQEGLQSMIPVLVPDHEATFS